LTANLQAATIISQENPSILGKFLHFIQAGLKSGGVDFSVACEKSRFGKNPAHISLIRQILRISK